MIDFSHQIFDEEPPKPRTLEDVLKEMSPEARLGLEAARLLQKEARETCPCPEHSPSLFEFDVQQLTIGHIATPKVIQEKADQGWAIEILGAHDDVMLFMFNRRKLCGGERSE